jgi:hypothetical protein
LTLALMADRPTIASVPQAQSELEFFDFALDLMVIVGFDGNYKRVNPAYERTSATRPGNCFPGRFWSSSTRKTFPRYATCSASSSTATAMT